MAAPRTGVVAEQYVTRVEVSPQVLDLKPGDGCRVGKESRHKCRGGGMRRFSLHLELHSLLHGTQMHRDVGGIGDQTPIGSKKGTGKVEAFLDVGGDGGALQDATHLFWGYRVTRHPLASPPICMVPGKGGTGALQSKPRSQQLFLCPREDQVTACPLGW